MKAAEFLALLDDRVMVCDGGIGTEFYARGVFINQCYDGLSVTRPSMVLDVHREYVEAGVDIIETNTFSANRCRLQPFGLAEDIEEINTKGVELARRATAGTSVLVAGAIGPLGLRIEPWGPTSVDEARAYFQEQVEYLVSAEVDLLILETFADLSEMNQAIAAVRNAAPDLPMIAQMTVGHDGTGLFGTPPESFAERLEQWGAHVIGLNCSVGPEVMLSAIERMAARTSCRLAVQPNAGTPRSVDGRNMYMATPEYLAEFAKRFVHAGVRLVGGCCGTSPRHMKAVTAAVRALSPVFTPLIPPPIEHDGDDAPQPGRVVTPVPKADKSAFGRKLARGEFVLTMELTPPRGIDASRVIEAARQLNEWGVDAINIPDGPRASARMSPLALAVLLEQQVGVETILHYCCRDRNLLGMQSDLMGASALGLHNLLIITGDPPKLGDYPDATAVFDVDSIGLTNVVNRLNHGLDIGENDIGRPTSFLIGVGANPGAIDGEKELKRFYYKVEAGAEFAITQPVFDVDLLQRFIDRIDEDHRIPIIAGIWPLTSYRNAQFMNNEVPGAHVPDRYLQRMAACATKEEARSEGVAIAREMMHTVHSLVQGVQISVPFGRTRHLRQLIEGATSLTNPTNSIHPEDSAP